jgi:ATP-dependent helicase/DNAse subunit B
MLLLTGPPGSGKTQHILEKIAASARRGTADVLLLTPTATMAEHLSHELARKLGALPEGLIQTLHRFVAGFATEFEPLSAPLLRRIVRRQLDAEVSEQFHAVADYPGFQNAIAALVTELSAAGVPAHRLEKALSVCQAKPVHSAALIALLGRIEDELLHRRKLVRGDRLRAVARRIVEDGPGGYREILFDGFFSFTRAELDLIRGITEHADVTVTLPRWPGSEHTREQLLRLGFDERALQPDRREPQYEIIRAQNEDAEAAEIARRILAEARAGRSFRDMGVIVRSGDRDGPALETTLTRFGIPARFYIGRSPVADAGVQQIVRIVESLRQGWDMESMLGVVRLSPAGARRDKVAFALLEQLPGKGLDNLRDADESDHFEAFWDRLESLDSWSTDRVVPSVWIDRLRRLPGMLPNPAVKDGVRMERAAAWKIRNESLRAFVASVEEAGELFEPGEAISLDEIWAECRGILDDHRLYQRDRRRNVVHVIDAFEARQWELPVFFVRGLVEDQFPMRHPDSPLLPDRTRIELSTHDVFLNISDALDQQEEFLFQLTVTRGTEKAFLSYPAHDQRGDPTLPSFQLAELRERLGKAPSKDAHTRSARPASPRIRPAPPLTTIYAEDLQAELIRRTETLSPSAIERFLTCPFQFFAERTLRLEEPPAAPADRLDPLVQGSIVHEVLKEHTGGREHLREKFSEVFHRHCAEENVQPGYQTERIRLDLLRSLEQFFEDDTLPDPAELFRELPFEIAITGNLAIRGRIDRVDVDENGRALVIDYKLSTPDRIRSLVKEAEEGRRVQGGLYMLAARSEFDLTPSGMLYCALRKNLEWDGWRLEDAIPDKSVGTKCTPEVLDEHIDRARDQAIAVAERIRHGEVAPLPAEENACNFCAGADICRRLQAEREATAGGAQ